MSKGKRATRKAPRDEARKNATKGSSLPSIPAAEALSFLRDTRGVSTWTARDMAESLKVSVAEAKRVIAVMEMQGYVNRFKADEWMTTSAGETVSGSKPPRYTRESIEKALSGLAARMEGTNRDASAPYQITRAVAFGDFFSNRTRLQAAEVGILLEERTPPTRTMDQSTKPKGRKSALRMTKRERLGQDIEATPQTNKRETPKQFLAKLRGKGGILHVTRYEEWMSARSHRKLLG